MKNSVLNHLHSRYFDTKLHTHWVDEDEMLTFFDRNNDYLKGWDRDYKIQHVRNSIERMKNDGV